MKKGPAGKPVPGPRNVRPGGLPFALATCCGTSKRRISRDPAQELEALEISAQSSDGSPALSDDLLAL